MEKDRRARAFLWQVVANCFRVKEKKKKKPTILSFCREEIIGCHSLLNDVNT